MGSVIEAAGVPAVQLHWVKDLDHETMEMLKASEVTKRVSLLVTSTTIVAARDVEAFLAEQQPDLVSSFLYAPSSCFEIIGFIRLVLAAHAFIRFSISSPLP